jgi:glutamine---fructose-6-phosphate transaminase (isomerizing)
MYTPLAVAEGPYLKDILEQPEALRRTLDSLPDLPELSRLLGPLAEQARRNRVVLTGMGSSHHALHPLSIRLNRAGYFAQMIETSELLAHYRPVLQPDTLTVVVSQSGSSAEIVRLLRDDALKGPTIGVTNTQGSPLATRSKVAILTEAGNESTVSCKTYLTSLAALHWMGAAITGEDAIETRYRLSVALEAVTAYLDDWQAHVDWFASKLQGVTRVFVAGRGWSLATAGTGGLILKESTRIAAEGMSSAALRHGPFESLSNEVLCVVCEGDSLGAGLNRRLLKDVVEAGGRALMLSNDAKERALRIPEVFPEMLPLVEILPIQMISLAIAALRGEEAGQFRLATKVTTVE